MYGLLALLPQSDAFRTLHARLNSIPTLALLQLEDPNGPLATSKASREAKPLLDFPALLQLFCERQVSLQKPTSSLPSDIPCLILHWYKIDSFRILSPKSVLQMMSHMPEPRKDSGGKQFSKHVLSVYHNNLSKRI